MNFLRRKQQPPRATGVLRCSFCNKNQRDVKKLIAGPNVYICNECVDICLDILNAPPEPCSETPAESAERSNIVANCSICRLPFDLAKGLHLEARGILCPVCVQAIEAALAQ